MYCQLHDRICYLRLKVNTPSIMIEISSHLNGNVVLLSFWLVRHRRACPVTSATRPHSGGFAEENRGENPSYKQMIKEEQRQERFRTSRNDRLSESSKSRKRKRSLSLLLLPLTSCEPYTEEIWEEKVRKIELKRHDIIEH
jgi:hypothetical protein